MSILSMEDLRAKYQNEGVYTITDWCSWEDCPDEIRDKVKAFQDLFLELDDILGCCSETPYDYI